MCYFSSHFNTNIDEKYQWESGKHLALSSHSHNFPGTENLLILQVQKIKTSKLLLGTFNPALIRASDTGSFHNNKCIPYASELSLIAESAHSYCCCLQLHPCLWGLKWGEVFSLTCASSRACSWRNTPLDIYLLYVCSKYVSGSFKISENSQG